MNRSIGPLPSIETPEELNAQEYFVAEVLSTSLQRHTLRIDQIESFHATTNGNDSVTRIQMMSGDTITISMTYPDFMKLYTNHNPYAFGLMDWTKVKNS